MNRGPASRPVSRRSSLLADPFVQWLALDPALAAAPRPLDLIVRKLAEQLEVDWVFVGELLGSDPSKVRTVSWWKDGRHEGDVMFAAAGSPCEQAIQGRPSYHPSGVSRRFPRAELIRSEAIEACAAHPLTAADGKRIGHIGAMSRRRFTDGARVRRLLSACAPRVGGEVERLRRARLPAAMNDPGAPETDRREHHLRGMVPEQDTLLREAHHRVKNNLQIVASLLAMQVRATSDPVVVNALSDAISRISTIALVHAQLSESPSPSAVDMAAFVEDLVRNLQRTFAELKTRVRIDHALDRLTLPLRVAIPSGLLIGELVTNAFQHAFAPGRPGRIEVRVVSDGDRVTIAVRDDGAGLPAEGERIEGLGLQLIRSLATRQLGGDLSIVRDGGTEISVTFTRGSAGSSGDERDTAHPREV